MVHTGSPRRALGEGEEKEVQQRDFGLQQRHLQAPMMMQDLQGEGQEMEELMLLLLLLLLGV